MHYYELDEKNTSPSRIRKEREKARKLRKTNWWMRKCCEGICHYCASKVPASMLTMDHVVPLARGGKSTPGNIVAACLKCNREKKLVIPVESLLEKTE